MQKNDGRIIRNKDTNQKYIGVCNEVWTITMLKWQKNPDLPMPLPVKHVYFDDTIYFEDVKTF